MKISIVQTSVEWEKPKANKSRLSLQLIKNIKDTNLIVLPEVFTTGFTMRAKKFAETMDGDSITWMLNTAYEFDAAVCGSLIIEEDKNIYNRFLWVQPDGKIYFYNKRHLFSFAGEDKYFTPGNERITIKYKCGSEIWNILPQVCYDLRFPVWSSWRGDYELMLYVANWPKRRSFPWKTLLSARAIENQSYVVGVNRIGDDGNGIYHSGDSSLIAPDGKVLFTASDKECIATFEINHKDVMDFRKQFPFLKNRDPFVIT